MGDLPASPRHEPLTPEQHEELAAQAFAIERRIKDALGESRKANWELAEALYEFNEAGGWGYTAGSLNEWLADPEISMSRAWFFMLIKGWRDLHVVRGVQSTRLQELEPSKVAEVVPAIVHGEVSVDDGLADAAELGQRDLRRKYRPEKRTQKPNAPLEASDEPVSVRCPVCNQWYTPEEPLEGDAVEMDGDGAG